MGRLRDQQIYALERSGELSVRHCHLRGAVFCDLPRVYGRPAVFPDFRTGGRASAPVTLLSLAGIAAATCLPFTPLGGALGLAPLPAAYFAWLAAIVAGYMALATAVKKLYMRRYGEWL